MTPEDAGALRHLMRSAHFQLAYLSDSVDALQVRCCRPPDARAREAARDIRRILDIVGDALAVGACPACGKLGGDAAAIATDVHGAGAAR